MPSNDVLTRNEEGDLAVRTVSATESSTVVNPNDVYTRDEDGNLAIRTVGSGGGDQHNLGYYATLTDLQTAYPTAEAGDWAIVGATDTVWIWDDTTSAWVDSDQKGQVTSVNNQTGDVTVQETLVSGTNIKTINNTSVLGSGNVAVQETLVSGTNIKTINNQSVLGSGNISIASGGGIDWTGHWDLPTTETTAVMFRLDCAILPKGHYRFYVQELNRHTSSYTTEAIGYPDTYMFDFYMTENPYDQSVLTLMGTKTRVIDGQSSFINGDVLTYNEGYQTAWKFDNGTKLGFESGMCNLGEIQNRQNVVNNAFRWTDVVNVDTGTTYPMTVYVDSSSVEPSVYDTGYSIIIPAEIPYPGDYTNYFYGVNSVSGQMWGSIFYNTGSFTPYGRFLDMYPQQDNLSVYIVCGQDEFEGIVYCKEDVYCEIKKATGIFANTEFVTVDGYIWLKYNFADSNMISRYATFYIGKNGGDTVMVSLSEYSEAPEGTVYEIPTRSVGSTVTAKNYGVISQYLGETNANYTNGYFYKASGTYTTVPSTATVTVSSPAGATVTIDFDALIPAIKKYMGWSYADVINRLESSNGYYDVNNQRVTLMGYQFEGTDVLACFTITGNQGQNVSFNISNLVVNEDTVSNGHWEQVNVQPAGSGSGLQNTATGSDSLTLLGTASTVANSVNVGTSSVILGVGGVAVGKSAKANTNGIAMGEGCESANFGIAIGRGQKVTANYAIQLGGNTFGTNNVANTFRVSNENGNFELMSANGTIPEARLADMTNAAQGQVLTLDANNNAVWATPSGGGGGGSTSATATLTVNDWSNNSQTVNVTGVTASNNVIVAPAPSSQADYSSAGVLCTAQGNGTLTFTCTSTPSSALTVNVLII